MKIIPLIFILIITFFTNSAASEVLSWPKHKTTPSILHFETGTLNGIRLGDPGQKMEAMGQPENKNFQVEPDWREYKYLSSGINFEDMESEIVVFRCYFHDRWHEGYSPSFLNLIANEKTLQIDSNTKKKDVLNFLGEPTEIEINDGVTILYYDFNKNFFYMFDFYNTNDRISIIHAYTKQQTPNQTIKADEN